MHNDVFLRCVSRRRQHRNYVCIDSPMKRWGWKRMKSGISHWRCLCLVWLLRSWTEEFGTIFTRESWWKYWVGFGFLSFTSCVWSLFSLCLVSFSSATPFRICCLQPLRSNELMFVLVKVLFLSVVRLRSGFVVFNRYGLMSWCLFWWRSCFFQ
jgi:hypothetical protein